MAAWQTRQGSRVLIEVCEDGQVVYLEGSGMTHLVDSVSGEVLRFLGDGKAQDLGAIRDLIFELTGDDLTPELAQVRWLQPLEEGGLVEEVT